LRQPLLLDYLTQNSIWWVEYLGLGGIRMDTYPYPDKHAMALWAMRVMREYPNFNITGEEWTIQIPILAYWQKGKQNPDGYEGHLPSLLDFPVQDALRRAFAEPEGDWGKGLIALYETLALDGLYPDASNLVTFMGNHDMPRYYEEVGRQAAWYRNALVFLLTCRGIPHLFYGDEILMQHPESREHGDIRKDFPGGWPGDGVDAFSGKGLSDEALRAQEFTRRLLLWRKGCQAVQTGQLLHYSPEESCYVLFRLGEKQGVMVVLNKRSQPSRLSLGRFEEALQGVVTGEDVIRGGKVALHADLYLEAMEPRVIVFDREAGENP
jgi:glycosidase